MKQISRVMEYFWLVVSIITAMVAISSFFQPGVGELLHPMFYILPLVAFGLFYARRWFRLRTEKNEENRRNSSEES